VPKFPVYDDNVYNLDREADRTSTLNHGQNISKLLDFESISKSA
jgi:hypothetical protein